MGLANYTPPNDGTEIKAKHLRDLWIALSAQVNGNLDGNNFANNSIAYAKLSIADGDISGDKITDDTIPTAKYENGSILPEHLFAGAGTDWEWQDWVPTWTNLTVGNGTVIAKYCQVGKIVHGWFLFTLGSTSAVSGATNFTLPVEASSDYGVVKVHIGVCRLQDASGADVPGVVSILNGDEGRIITWLANATYVNETDLSSTVPFIWTSTDSIGASFSYEAA